MKNVLLVSFIVSLVGLIGFSFTNCGGGGRRTVVITPTDGELNSLMAVNNLRPLQLPPQDSPDLIALGKALFNDVALSGPRDTSCATCHSDVAGSGDGLAFALGTGAIGTFPNRRQVNGRSLPVGRHSPSLFNLVRPEQPHAVWDGRLGFISGIPSSPVASISGSNPSRSDITSLFTNVFDIQPLFPLLSPRELLGTNNSLANLNSEEDIWEEILTRRLLNQPSYVQLFSRAFPTTSSANLNPGHIGRAMGAFMKAKFLANNSPFDRYIAGDTSALTDAQKRGMKVFYTQGACNSCHSGTAMTNNQFASSGVPQIGFSPFFDDLGREEVTNNPNDRYKFKIPGLRNVGLSAPFMHNGALENLEALVEHYNDIPRSLSNYQIPSSYQRHYDATIIHDTSSARNSLRLNAIFDPRLRNGLGLSSQQKEDLVEFLRNGLTDESFRQR